MPSFRPLLIALALAPLGAQADSASRVSAVKVYPGSATVERTLRLPAGAREARFACLPAGLDANSLQVHTPPGVRVGEIAVRQQPRELLGDACRSPLEARIQKLEDELAALSAESAGIDMAAGYLKSFGNAPSGADARAAQAGQITATVAALKQSAQTALTRQHQLTRQQEALARELKPLIAERDRVGAARAQVSVVQINLAAPQGGELRLSYQVRGPSWQPSYRATLDSTSGQVRLERQALVAQNTGEDWGDVQLTLSTGQPGAATQGPLPRPWRIGIAPPTPPQAELMAEPAPAMAPAPMSRARAGGDAAADDMPRFDVSVFDSRFATEFAVPQRITVPSSGQRITLALGEQALPARLLTRTTPAQDPSAYLIAELAAPEGVWPAGPIGLYRDGAFVGNGRFDAATLAQSGLAFGRDERVNVRVEQPGRTDGTSGFITSRNERRTSRIYTVENRHREAITLQVLDAAPVAEHEDVRIGSTWQPEPQTKAWNEQPGTVLWQQSLAAGASQRFTAEHVVSWPKDARLRERQ
ncbi:MAG: mucoidy inhibitor MuiA family protein [Pseudomonadota bacterium]|nr:mucoidy inhibitor MuiA family protein [Pseudomonadota bacterium]